jgi:hypothetical protein
LNHGSHYVAFRVTLLNHVPHLLEELEDDAGHVASEHDPHLCQFLVAVPMIGAQSVEILASEALL